MPSTPEPSREPRRTSASFADSGAEQLIKSRQRVKAHGEVFTPRRMVNQMLDLVSDELETGPQFVDKTFFEPSAGDGNFLIAILQRKLHAIEKRYQREFWPTESLFALASIYGIELLDEAQYRQLQELGSFDQKTSSWLRTPGSMRKLDGALFGDRRYERVFTYHNGVQSYYAARGFRGVLKV